jgi:hypothetical protein
MSFNKFPLDLKSIPAKPSRVLPPSPLAPGGKVFLTTGIDKPLNEPTLNAAIARSHAFYVIGEIRYVDAFGHPRETDFLAFCTGDAVTKQTMASYDSGNRIT